MKYTTSYDGKPRATITVKVRLTKNEVEDLKERLLVKTDKDLREVLKAEFDMFCQEIDYSE